MSQKESARSNEAPLTGKQPDPENGPDGRNDQGLPVMDEASIRTLVAGWSAQYLKPQLDAEEPVQHTAVNLILLNRIEKAFDERITLLTDGGILPERRPGEDYSPEYAPILNSVYEEARKEVGWDPLQQSAETGRELK